MCSLLLSLSIFYINLNIHKILCLDCLRFQMGMNLYSLYFLMMDENILFCNFHNHLLMTHKLECILDRNFRICLL